MKTFLTTLSLEFEEKETLIKKTQKNSIVTICNMKARADKAHKGCDLKYLHYFPTLKVYKSQNIALKSVEDEHNPVFAKKLAETRARIAVLKLYKKDLKEAYKKARKEMEFIENTLENVNKVIDNEITYESELLVREEEFKESWK